MARTARRISLPRERNRLVAVAGERRPHPVRCPRCRATFDLFAAPWCPCPGAAPSKTCPSCGDCACALPAYRDARLWAEAPPAFVREGFEKLFVAYV